MTWQFLDGNHSCQPPPALLGILWSDYYKHRRLSWCQLAPQCLHRNGALSFYFFFIFCFIGYFVYLHFKCYFLSQVPLQKIAIPSTFPCFYEDASHSLTPASLPSQSPTLRQDQGHHLIVAQQGHPLLHMHLEPWVPLCVLFGWWFSPWELWVQGGWSGCLMLLFSYGVADPLSSQKLLLMTCH